ncbi:MAG: fumarylacetoacetate hydrolase family protein [Chloroflexi bacterium]|nr:fumarylacetoacetate hydrolase family protein [Chloroflexota bacterium]
MRIVRFSSQCKVKYGVLDGDTIRSVKGSPFAKFKHADYSPVFDGSTYNLKKVKLLAPCTPSKIVCLGLNYRRHAEETNLPIPEVPLIFLKPSTAVIGPDDEIVLPRESRRVDYEAELGVVIGKRSKAVVESEVENYILGYTCFNDVSERYNQRDDVQWTRAKGYDTFAPLGPWIETDISPDDLKIETYLNGELRQSARTSDLIFAVPKLVSFISGVMTLLPGDVVATGTPSGIGRMSAGDTVEITIENIGILRNSVTNVR